MDSRDTVELAAEPIRFEDFAATTLRADDGSGWMTEYRDADGYHARWTTAGYGH